MLKNASMKMASLMLATALGAGLVTGCGDDDDPAVENPTAGEENEEEVITTVNLTFTPEGGGDVVTASFRDADGDGGDPPTTDAITLAADTTYTLTVEFLNGLESPPEDITEEVREEGEEHQLFFTGGGIQSEATADDADAIATFAYGDTESTYGENAVGDDLPVGLSTTVTTAMAGSGDLVVTLQHLPPVDGSPIKVAGLAATVASGSLGSLPGEADVSVTFALTVE